MISEQINSQANKPKINISEPSIKHYAKRIKIRN